MKRLFVLFCGILTLFGWSGNCYAETVAFDADKWVIKAKESKLELFSGQKSLLLQDGYAMVKDS